MLIASSQLAKQPGSTTNENHYQLLITFLSDWSYAYKQFTMKALVLSSSSAAIAHRSTVQVQCSASFGLGLHSMLRLSTVINVNNPMINSGNGWLELNDQSVVRIVEEQDSTIQSVRSILMSNTKTPSTITNRQSSSLYNNNSELINMTGYLTRRHKITKSQIHLVLRDTTTPDTIDVYVKRSHLIGCIPNHVQLILYNVSKRYSSQSGKVYISFMPGMSRIIQRQCTKNQSLSSYATMSNMKLISLYSNNNTQRIYSQRAIFQVESCDIYAIHKFIYQIGSKWCHFVCTIDDGTQRALLIIRDVDIIRSLFPKIDEQVQCKRFSERHGTMSDGHSSDVSDVVPTRELSALKLSLFAKLAHTADRQVNHLLPRSDGQFHNPFPYSASEEEQQGENTKQNHQIRAEKIVLVAEAVSVLSSLHHAVSDTRDCLESLVSSALSSLNLQ